MRKLKHHLKDGTGGPSASLGKEAPTHSEHLNLGTDGLNPRAVHVPDLAAEEQFLRTDLIIFKA